MFHALYTAASGMTAQQINLDNIANNLANASTSGFQSRRVQFSDLLYQSEVMPGAAATQQTTVAAGLQVGLGTRPGNTEIIQTQGDLSSTGNPLDFAIEGTGFFQVLLPNNQIGYTRSGSFQPNAQGALVTANGDALQPAITIPANATNITVGSDGTVSATLPGQTNAAQVGTIQLATFANPGGLNSIGNNIYLATTASGDPVVGTPGGADGLGTIQRAYRVALDGGGSVKATLRDIDVDPDLKPDVEIVEPSDAAFQARDRVQLALVTDLQREVRGNNSRDKADARFAVAESGGRHCKSEVA